MNPTAEHTKLDGCLRQIQFEIPKEDAEKSFNSIAREFAGKLQIKGFRPGKAPLSVIRGRYQREIEAELVRKQLAGWMKTEIEEHKLRICGEPEVVDIDATPDGPLSIRVQFEVLPDVEPKDYTGIELTDAGKEITDADVETELAALRERLADYVPVEDRDIQPGDHAVCDFTILKDEGEEKKENILVDTASSETDPVLRDKLLSLKPGEETEYIIEPRKEKDEPVRSVAAKVVLKGMKEKKLRDLDDEFARDVGEFETLQQLKDQIKENLVSQNKSERDRAFREQLIKELVKRNPSDVPEVLIDQELSDMITRMQDGLRERGAVGNLRKINWEKLAEQQRPAARDSILFSLLLREIARKENIEITDEDVDKEIERFAKASNVTVEKIRSNINKNQGLDSLKADMRERAVVDFLVENGRIIGRENQNDIDPHRG